MRNAHEDRVVLHIGEMVLPAQLGFLPSPSICVTLARSADISPTGIMVRLHSDVDCFFVAVEQLRRPALRHLPVAVQQHQDIISVNYAARAAGVRKHMVPAKAREILHPIGGQVVHVHTEAGSRVSYKPYMQVSATFFKLLKSFPGVKTVEKASIDEAYIEVTPRGNAACISLCPPFRSRVCFRFVTKGMLRPCVGLEGVW